MQACANDPQVAVHAVRNLARIGQGVVSVRWSQLGFGRTSSTSTGQATPRNLFGMKDGTDNLKAENYAALDRFVWVATATAPDWLAGGSYLVTRRIRMEIETWDRQPLREQEHTIGRTKGTGAPLGQQAEFDPVDFRSGPTASRLSRATSHVFLAHPQHAGTAILRRGLQLRRRLRRPGPARRRAVLHRLPARSGDRLRAGAAATSRRHDERVHHAHVVGGVRLPARRARRRRLVGPDAVRLRRRIAPCPHPHPAQPTRGVPLTGVADASQTAPTAT